MNTEDYIAIFKQLDTLVLRTNEDRSSYQRLGEAPAWFSTLFPTVGETLSEEQLLALFPLLSSFLPTVDFQNQQATTLESSVWEVDEQQGQKLYFSGLAIEEASHLKYLLIQKKNSTITNTRNILQKARELSLAFDHLEEKHQQLLVNLQMILADYTGPFNSLSNTLGQLRGTLTQPKQEGQLQSMQRQLDRLNSLHKELEELL